MTIEFRPATAADVPEFGAMTAYAYAGAFGDGDDNQAMHANRPEWTLCAFDGPTMVACYATIPFTMRGNGKPMALGGVTTVATAPEYRRQGLLRAITSRALARQRDAGQTVAALWASQAAIYQRYGYAAGSAFGSYHIDTADLNLLDDADEALSVARTPVAQAFDDLKNVYRQFVADRTLYLHRAQPLWQANVLTADATSGPVHIAVCRNRDGAALGYVVYTLRSGKVDHPARSQEIVVRDLVWLSLDAYRALWQFLRKHDLVGRISWQGVPAGDPLPELLQEPRLLHASSSEGIWFRVVDAAAACAARGYDAAGELVFEIREDPLTPWNDGVWKLTAGGGSADVQRTSATPELTFSIKQLSSVFCGYRRVSELAGWGLVAGTDAALARADRLFATRHPPHCPDHF